MRAAYTGHETLTFTDYTDAETGKTLTAEPGGIYDVTPSSGHPVPDLPAGWFTPAGPEGWAPAHLVEDIPLEAVPEVPEVPAEPMENPEALEPQQDEAQQD